MFYNTTGSLTATNVITAIMIINLTASSIAVLATASRQLWAFARNGGVPFSQVIAPVRHHELRDDTILLIHFVEKTVLPRDIPTTALFISLAITICLSLINIGSSAALNAIFSLNTGSLITSYMITISCTILRRLQGHPLPIARFTLGKYGLPINIAAICYLLPVWVFSFFPGAVNPTPATMNWGVVMYAGVIITSTVYYIFKARFNYSPPEEHIKEAIEALDRFYEAERKDRVSENIVAVNRVSKSDSIVA
jgi:amino acid transporter